MSNKQAGIILVISLILGFSIFFGGIWLIVKLVKSAWE